jgi:hypothetical protein
MLQELPRTPPSEVTSGQENSGEKWLRLLMDMGFQEEQVLKALGNNPDSFDEVLGAIPGTPVNLLFVLDCYIVCRRFACNKCCGRAEH